VDVAPSDCWVIEDSLQGIASGLAAGARVVGITTSHTAEELAHTQVIAPNFVDLFAKIADL
jgi:beta-phosphoglucomutase-like phosphatase (HAD superfamily)